MIPQKLYIPTTTLNFNNIMASESISPAGFYSIRGFSYKRFDKVKPNNLDRRITLYDKYPNFDINDIELENYPLVIEIAPKDVDEDIIQEYRDGIFYTEETIYLNPFSTKIYFRNEDEKRRTLSKVEQSLNTKMVSIYQNRICIKTSCIDSFEWKKSDLTDSIIDFANHISKDRRINKLKGFLYAYLLGINRSLSREVVILKKHAKELRNTISAIITNSDEHVNSKQEADLKTLYWNINYAFSHADGIIQNRLKQKAEEYKCPNFIDILRKEDLYNTWFQKQNLTPSYQIKTFNLFFPQKNYTKTKSGRYNNNELEEKQKYFDAYFIDLDNAIGKYVKSINANTSDLPILQHCNIVDRITSDKSGFQAKLFNEYSGEHWNSEEFLASRLDFATAGGKLFKEELQDEWENSPSKTYINDLRKNIASHTPFTISSVSNLTLQSFAVFCQKGEEDIDRLEDYLISNGIGDFRIAFALWGIVFGFANMPKTLTNDLFLSDDMAYKSEIYKYIFKQVHGIELDGEFESKKEDVTIIPSRLNGNINYNKSEIIVANTNNHKLSLDIEDKLKPCKLNNETLETIKELYKKNNNQASKSFFDSIKRIKGIGDAKLKRIKDALGHIEQESTKTLYQQIPIGEELYKDANIYNHIEPILPNDPKIKKQFKIDLDWFQDNYKEIYKDKNDQNKKGQYCDKPKDNVSVIENFNRYLENKQNQKDSENTNMQWLRNIYKQIDIHEINSMLKKLYK
ncbi:hypothetical protein [Bacteroides graminisolvens]